ncbi:hypothetical protein FRC12_022879 [Ceratobasidium sp. 428]|nr:hypothetical protein FRC12_022879 [Ceratobasidium sp. 428]
MAINPCLKFRWIDEHWTNYRRSGARLHLKEAMLKVRQQMHRAFAAPLAHAETSAERNEGPGKWVYALANPQQQRTRGPGQKQKPKLHKVSQHHST